jgi:hypothetical protein
VKYVVILALLFASSAFAETSKFVASPEIQKTIRGLLASGGRLNESDSGIVTEVQVVDSYKIVGAATAAALTTVKVELKIGAVKKYDEATHRYKETKLPKSRDEQIVIELKNEGKATSLVHPIGSYSLR